MRGMNKGFVCLLLLSIAAVAIPAPEDRIRRQDEGDGAAETPEAVPGSEATPAPGDCREVQYPCTRVYSVQKPVKQCLSYLCVTSVRRVYMLNKEICTRLMCKEHEVILDEKCRQKAGLPPRRFQPPETTDVKPTPEEGA
ncbi:microfibrillar-associated protein 5 [Spea bombifrons]|uniref:microfibrillar-associated protein 5 n=1 Tax=Spea bombifrons TaxID=233779 RepID=UPI00234AF0AF|nr:microfibrillar-associated protein 5 [Spea bombifrons]